MGKKLAPLAAAPFVVAGLLFGTVSAGASADSAVPKVPSSHPLASPSPEAKQKLMSLPVEVRADWEAFIDWLELNVPTGKFSDQVQRDLEKTGRLESTTEQVAAVAERTPPQTAPDLRTQKAVGKETRANDDTGHNPQNETSIEANPNGSKVVAGANDYRNLDVHCGVYTGDGNTYDMGRRKEQILPHRGAAGFDPAVDFDTEGNAYYACDSLRLRHDGVLLTEIEVSKSTDNGETWTFPVVADRGTRAFSFEQVEPGCFEFRVEERFLDKPYLTAGHPAPSPDPTATPPVRNKVYISYTEFITRFFARSGPACPPQTSASFGENINVLRSPDGVNWKGPVTLDRQFCPAGPNPPPGCGPFARLIQGSNPYATHRDGKLYVAWYDSTNDGWMLGRMVSKAARSLDGGATFDPPEGGTPLMSGCEISGGTGNSQSFVLPPTVFRAVPTMFPVIRTSHFDTDRLYVVHGADPDSPGTCVGRAGAPSDDADVFFGSTEWAGAATVPAEPQRVNDDTGTQDQFFAWLTVSGEEQAETAKSAAGEVIAVTWGDRRRDFEDIRYDWFAAASPDGPATTSASFRPNKRLTTLRSSPNTQFGGLFIGDYNASDADSQYLYASWTDSRFSNESPCIPTKVGSDGAFDKNGEMRCVPNLDEDRIRVSHCSTLQNTPCNEGSQDAYVGRVSIAELLGK
jgi:hypothetical protein